jgi:hypothetical protein
MESRRYEIGTWHSLRKRPTVEFFLVDGGGQYIAACFTVDEELNVTSMFSNDFALKTVAFLYVLCT